MVQRRIYGENVSINTESVRKFYNKRAALVAEKGWGAISLGDEDPTIASRAYNYDRDVLFPKLNVDASARVLELGCGMGRWAEIVLPHCGFYCGVDFSEEMLCAAQKEAQFYEGAFHCVILSGVCIYINDGELKRTFERIPELCQEHCTICVKETATTADRLTLNEFPSEALHSNYNAIYRTTEEYMALFQPLLKAGFSISEQYFLPTEVGRKRAETNGWCTIFKR